MTTSSESELEDSAELDALVCEVDGRSGVWFTRVIREDLPTRVREGLARRRIAIAFGMCPCGARPRLVTRTETPPQRRRKGQQRRRQPRRAPHGKRSTYVEVRHADACPATDPEVVRYLADWRSGT